MVKHIYRSIQGGKVQLAVCSVSKDGYTSMKYYEAIWHRDLFSKDLSRGFEDGYFIHNYDGYYDFFTVDEFNECFLIVDNCSQTKASAKATKLIKWLYDNKDIVVLIRPHIEEDGYNYSYGFIIDFPFTCSTAKNHFDSYELAVKDAINMVKEICLKKFGSTITEWLKFTKNS